jgi:hypothetical protein
MWFTCCVYSLDNIIRLYFFDINVMSVYRDVIIEFACNIMWFACNECFFYIIFIMNLLVTL